MGKIWRDFGHAFSFDSSSSRGMYPSPSYLIWMCCTRFPLDLSCLLYTSLPFWAGLDEVINQYIDSVTLEQLSQSLPAAKDGCCGCNTKT